MEIVLKLGCVLTGPIQVYVEENLLVPDKDYDVLDYAIRFRSLNNYDYVAVHDLGSKTRRVYLYNDCDFDLIDASKIKEVEATPEVLSTCRDHIIDDIMRWKRAEQGYSKSTRWHSNIWDILRREDLRDHLLSMKAVELVLLYQKIIVMRHRQM